MLVAYLIWRYVEPPGRKLVQSALRDWFDRLGATVETAER